MDRADIISQIEGELTPPVEEEVPNSEPILDTPSVEPEVEKEAESQTAEPSTSPEPIVESEQEAEIGPKIELSDEDIDKTYQDKKTNMQKRVDRLTAEKKTAQEELRIYKEKVEALEAKFLEQKSDKPTDYSDEQLAEALNNALADGDGKLVVQIQKHIVERQERKQKALKEKEDLEANAFKQQETDAWNSYVETFPYEDDPEMNLKDKDSLLLRYTSKLYQDRPKHYDKFGAYRLIQAVNDARDLILQSRINKINTKQAETLQKKLEREKLKNELGAGVSGVDQVNQTSNAPLSANDILEERFAINRKSRLAQTS